MATSNAPPSALLNDKQLTEPVNSPFPIIAIVASDTEFQTRMWGYKQVKIYVKCY